MTENGRVRRLKITKNNQILRHFEAPGRACFDLHASVHCPQLHLCLFHGHRLYHLDLDLSPLAPQSSLLVDVGCHKSSGCCWPGWDESKSQTPSICHQDWFTYSDSDSWMDSNSWITYFSFLSCVFTVFCSCITLVKGKHAGYLSVEQTKKFMTPFWLIHELLSPGIHTYLTTSGLHFSASTSLIWVHSTPKFDVYRNLCNQI